MRFSIFASFVAALYGQPAAIEADVAFRLRSAFEQIPRPANRTQAEQSVEPLRAKLKHAIGLHRVSQAVRFTILAPSPLVAGPPLLILLVPECAAQAPVFARRGFLTVCVNQMQAPSFLAGITAQGRIQHDIARVLSMPNIDRSRIMLVGQGPAAVIAAALFPQFTQIAIDSPSIDGEAIHGIAHFADTLQLLALAAPRSMLVSKANTTLTDPLRDHYRLYEAGDKLFLDSDPLQWLEPNGPPVAILAPEDIELPAQPATNDSKLSLPQIAGTPLPAARMTMALNLALVQQITFRTQSGIEIPVTVFRSGPTGGGQAQGTLIAMSDQGRASLSEDEVVKEAYRRNWDVFAVDPRGLGAMRLTDEVATRIASFQLGEYFPSRQVTDVARIVDFIARPTTTKRSGIYARGPRSSLIAALLAPNTPAEWIFLRDPAASFEFDPPFYPGFDLQTLLQNTKFVAEPRFD